MQYIVRETNTQDSNTLILKTATPNQDHTFSKKSEGHIEGATCFFSLSYTLSIDTFFLLLNYSIDACLLDLELYPCHKKYLLTKEVKSCSSDLF